MNCDPEPKQTLILWWLLANRDGDFNKNIKPLTTKDRKELVDAGLIAVEKRKDARTGRRCNHVALTDAGWQWAETHLDREVSPSKAAAPILRDIMILLKDHLARHQIPLAAFVDPSCDAITDTDPWSDCQQNDGAATSATASLPTTEGSSDLQQRVVSACRTLANGRPAARIRLAALRAELADVSCEQLDEMLLDMEEREALVLYPLDNPQELSPADMEAALPNSAGFNRHILYLEN